MSHKEENTNALEPQVETLEEQIRLAAYYIWKEKGEQHGCDQDDWYEAEKSCCD